MELEERKSRLWGSVEYLSEEEKRETIPLWQECFPEDSEEFLEYYYTWKTRENRIAVLREKGKMISMLHRNPYRLRIGKKVWKTDYIVAVATKEEYRGRGAMGTVLTTVLQDMRREKQPFTFLMPAAEAIYAPYDFRFFASEKKISLVSQDLQAVPVKNTPEDYEKAAQFMEEWLAERYDVYTVRDRKYAEGLAKEAESEKGRLSFLYKEGKIVGIQAIWGLEKQEQRILYAGEKNCKSCEGKPLMMGRIVDAEEFLSAFTLKQEGRLEVKLRIKDPLIKENNGTFFWTLTEEKSVLQREEDREPALCAAEYEEPIQLDAEVGELILWLFGQQKPEELWKGISKERKSALDRVKCMEKVCIDEVV